MVDATIDQNSSHPEHIQDATTIDQNSSHPDHIQLESFSGPLDLLLQLIRDQEMDIFKIDICKITNPYVEYIKNIPKPDIEKAGDFIKIASLLMYIKSKTLLPKDEMEEEETSQLKQNLTRLLVHYQKYQTAGNMLYAKELLGRDTFLSTHKLNLQAIPNNEIEINQERASFLLSKAYGQILQNQQITKAHKTKEPLPSLLDRVQELADVFIQGAKTSFYKLIGIKQYKYSKLLTFLSLLELSKLGFIAIYQKSPWGDIEVDIKKNIEEKDFILLNNEEKDWLQSEQFNEVEN